MDPPSRLDAVGIRQEKLKVFRSIELGKDFTNNIVFGQYNGYLDEKDVAPGSRTETFVAMKVEVDTWNFI
jgi:glucose-6-phosphate 1-dehydrogenase